MVVTGLALITAAVVGWLVACDNDARAMASRMVARLRERLRLRKVPALRVDGCRLSGDEQAALSALEAAEAERERRPT